MDSIGVMTLAAGLLAIGVGIIAFFNNEYDWGVLLFIVGWITIGVVINHFVDKKKGK